VPHHRIATFYPIHCGGGWHSHICLSLCEHMQAPELTVEMLAPTSDPPGRTPFTRDAIHPWLKTVVFKVDRRGAFLRAVHRARYRRALARSDVAYLWAATPEAIYRDVKAADRPLVVERINCHRATSRPILDEAYRRAGLAPGHGITDEALAEERRKLALADWIFAPSPLVRRSLLDDGIAADKVLSSSYGWSPRRIEAAKRRRPLDAPPTFLFVGTVCIRKGAHHLLDAWSAAGIKGRLELCGQVAAEVKTVSAAHLARADVDARGHVTDVAQAYADADVFAFPTHEEGSPLVVYEAMARGLPILTTAMGAGDVVRHGVEGLVLDPYDRDAWIWELRRLAGDPALRARLGDSARRRAREFTWDRVGARRRELLLVALGGPLPRELAGSG
jgi:glycosyltransferase involved in cell wall biosynthesis